MLAGRKTASQSNRQGHTADYQNIASHISNTRVEQDKYNNEQAPLIVQAHNARLKHVIINHTGVQPKVAVKEVGKIQSQRILKVMRTNGPPTAVKTEADEKEFENTFGSLNEDMAPDTVRRMACNGDNGGNPPPQRPNSNISTPLRVPDDGDDDPDDIPLSAFSVTRKPPNDDGDEPPDHDNGGNGGHNSRQTNDN